VETSKTLATKPQGCRNLVRGVFTRVAVMRRLGRPKGNETGWGWLTKKSSGERGAKGDGMLVELVGESVSNRWGWGPDHHVGPDAHDEAVEERKGPCTGS